MTLRVALILSFLFAFSGNVSHAQKTQNPAATVPSRSKLQETIRRSRTQAMQPRSTPPTWMDYEKVQFGFAFLRKHNSFVQQILGTSSLAATFAAKDIAPILVQTGRLPKEFSQRMQETGYFMNIIMRPPADQKEFQTKNLTQAYQLGQIHEEVAKLMAKELRWDPKERVVMNQQAYGFVLYSFAWWPVEALEATKQLPPGQPSKELEGWLHLWSVIGYEMGVAEELLPINYALAKERVTLLRRAQYASAGETTPDGVRVLLGQQVRWLAAVTSGAVSTEKQPLDVALPAAAAQFAQVLQLSPGLCDALGLGPDPTAQLLKDATAVAPKPPAPPQS